jgi:hypothetical protein
LEVDRLGRAGGGKHVSQVRLVDVKSKNNPAAAIRENAWSIMPVSVATGNLHAWH